MLTSSDASSAACPLCGGAGYVRVQVPIGDPNFGRLFPCECKLAEIANRNHKNLEQRSNLEAFADKTFATFDARVAGIERVVQAAHEYARNPNGWLFLLGGYGCGKTHLAAAIAHEAISRGLHTYFAIAPDLLDYLRSAYDPNATATGGNYDTRFDMVREMPLLIVDDLGTENTTAWAREKLYQIFNYRYNYRLPTVVTSNVDLETLDPRIASRICDQALCRHLYIDAPDYRLRNVNVPRRGTNGPPMGGNGRRAGR